MSLTLLVVTFLVLVVLALVLQSFFLWVGAKLVKIPGVSYRRALLTCVVISVVCVPIQGGIALCGWWLGDSVGRTAPLAQLSLAVLSLGLGLALPWLCVKWFLRTGLGRAALATLVMLVGGFVASLGLALTLRHTLVEAFVIPTGSMAPTIFGAHADLTCENCGRRYAVSMSKWAAPLARRPREPVAAACANCGQPDNVPVGAAILSGDRILVEKISRPSRWDLVVFKYPEDPSVNFIDRLVGLPGETLEIVAGDIFIGGKRLKKEPGTAVDMWLPVQDTSYVARQRVPEGPGWEPAGGSSHWRHAGGEWTFAGNDAEPEVLSFSGRLTDELAYNGREIEGWLPEQYSPPLVGDVKVECRIEGFSGEGSFSFLWEFRNQRVRATVSASGTVEIASSVQSSGAEKDEGRQRAASGRLSGDVSEKQHLAFAFRDGQAYVAQNGAVVASLPAGPEGIEEAKDRLQQPAEPCRLEIVAERCLVTFSRIRLWKDVYYRNLAKIPGAVHPINLGQDGHFMLGDNSGRSKDSRFWGTVASDQIIGVARWIYWPPSRRHEFH